MPLLAMLLILCCAARAGAQDWRDAARHLGPPGCSSSARESELKAVIPQLPGPKAGQYGRADQASAKMVLAHLYLVAKVYVGTDRSADALNAASAVIISNAYTLDPNFRRMFGGDNNTSPELICTVPQDGVHTRTWGGMTYLVHAGVGGNMDASKYGIDGGWWGLRLRPEAANRYQGGPGGPDLRTSFFVTNGQSMNITDVGNFQQGIGAPKYTNVTSTGRAGSNATFPDTDYPMFRLADAYLIYAEAVLRGGGGSAGFRRQDLLRFGQFSDAGVWSWKGGVPAGKTTNGFRNLYPLPANELSANPNIKQNPGY